MLFFAIYIFFLLPALIGLFRAPLENILQRANTSLVVAAAMCTGALAWWLEVVIPQEQKIWIQGYLIISPIVVLLVLRRGTPSISLRQDMPEKKIQSALSTGWNISLGAAAFILAGMTLVLTRG